MKIVNDQIYVVRRGDTINSIAKKYGVNPTTILIVNSITPKLKEGQVIYIKN